MIAEVARDPGWLPTLISVAIPALFGATGILGYLQYRQTKKDRRSKGDVDQFRANVQWSQSLMESLEDERDKSKSELSECREDCKQVRAECDAALELVRQLQAEIRSLRQKLEAQ